MKKSDIQVRDRDGFIYDVHSVNGDVVTAIADNGKLIDFNRSDIVFLN